MPRYLALDWDAGEIRMVRGEVHAGRTRVTAVASLPVDAAGQDAWSSPVPWKNALAPAVARYDLRHVPTFIAVRRGLVQLQDLRLPPAPKEELPELVRFLADKQFGTIAADDAFDYLPIAHRSPGNGERRGPGGVDRAVASEAASRSVPISDGPLVLAALLAGDRFRTILEVCRLVDIKPRAMTLTGLATASRLAHAPRAETIRSGSVQTESVQTELAVDLLDTAVEMTLLVAGRAVFMRTVRLPAGAAGTASERTLAAELTRTLAAAENRPDCGVVETVTVLAHGGEHAELVAHLKRELDVHLRTFDPFATIELAPNVVQAYPAHAGRFGPALGMLLDGATQRRPAIDWLNPHQAARKQNRYRPLVLATVAVVLLAGSLAARTWRNVARLDRQIERASAQLQELDQISQRLQEAERRVAPLDRWLASDIDWLDELYRLADCFPPPEDGMLTQLQVVPRGDAVAMLLEGRAREHPVIDTLETRLRDERHKVVPLMSHHESDHGPYAWRFKSTVHIVANEPHRPRPALGDASRKVSRHARTTGKQAAGKPAADARAAAEAPTGGELSR